MTIMAPAAVLTECPGDLAAATLDIDSPAAGEVLVRTAAAGLCHSDLHFMRGTYRPPLPIVLGHEVAGVVEQVGPGVSYIGPGDHVAGCLSVFCGECGFCVTGRPYLCTSASTRRPPDAPPRLQSGRRVRRPVHQGGQLGGFAGSLLVHEHALVKIDPAMPLDRAAVLGCAVMTGVGAVFRTARVKPGSTVAVIGCGGVGLNVIQGAVLAGASRVIAIDQRAAKLDLAKRFGATDVLDRRGRTGANQRRSRVLLRGDRADGNGRAVLRHAGARRHGDRDRAHPGRRAGQPRRQRVLDGGEADPGLHPRIEPVPVRPAEARRPLPAGPAQP
jgi:S-(hydroxymethyl)glutathione dehydrogenase / alcohol dehydrogenase